MNSALNNASTFPAAPTSSSRRRTVIEWFDSVSDLAGRAPAVYFDGKTLSYQELRERSGALAAELVRRYGVRPEQRVAVLMERSADLVVALLAILEAGAVYLPIDPTLPRLRVEAMLADGQPRVLLVSSRTEALAEAFACSRVVIDAPAMRQPQAGTRLPRPQLEQIAYLLYSSGTTGRPKAIMGTHHCLSNLVAWQLEHDAFPAGARVLQYSPMGFDVSLQEILTALLSGGTLSIAPDAMRADLPELCRFVVNQAITVLYLPVVVLNELFGRTQQLDWSGNRLERLIVAGEALRVSPGLREFLQRNPKVMLHNHYGPTETHVATGSRFDATCALPDMPPIGNPVADTNVYLLDPRMDSVQAGTAGEIYLSGPGVARGYFGQPALTSERFVPDPTGNGLCYRTGDLARWRSDGQLEFLGRRDDQAKVKGYRVEPREIGRILLESERVEDVFVRAQPSPAGTMLAVYLVTRGSQDVSELRRYLAARVPEYMVPAQWFAVDFLPKTVHGKIDERALARLQIAGSSGAPDTGDTGSDCEQAGLSDKLSGLWCEILGRPVGMDDDFFELGGESLRGMQLIARVHRELGIGLRLRDLFDAPTVRGMASVAATRMKGDAK